MRMSIIPDGLWGLFIFWTLPGEGGEKPPWEKRLPDFGESEKSVLPDFAPEGGALDAQFTGRFRTIASIFS